MPKIKIRDEFKKGEKHSYSLANFGGQKKRKHSARKRGYKPSKLPNDLKVGDIVLCRTDKAFKIHRRLSPCYVYAIYKKEGQIVAIDAISFKTNLSRNNPSDFIFKTEEELKRVGSDRPSKINCTNVFTIENSEENFTSKIIKLNENMEIFCGVLMRRAHALLQTSINNYTITDKAKNIVSDKRVIRAGATFSSLPASSIMNGLWAPDLSGGDFQRENVDYLDSETVNQLALFSNSFVKGRIKPANMCNFTFPSFSNIDCTIPAASFPNWNHRYLRAPHLTKS